MTLLTETQISAALNELKQWTNLNGKLHREYKFPHFAHAIGFMATAAFQIEKNNHHPEWSNVYNRVTVDLTTHDAGGITQNDVDLAIYLEGLAQRLS